MAAAGGPRLVVRNTFLEVFDDTPSLGETERAQGRPRAQTDLTDAKLPRKVSYPVDADGSYPLLGVGLTAPAGGYSPVHLGSFAEESPAHALHGKGGSPLMPAGHPGAMGMPPFPGFGGPFPPPWAYPAMGPGAPPPFPGLPGMPWGYPPAPFPVGGCPAPMVQPQGGRGAGRRNQGEKGGSKRGGGNRWAQGGASENAGGGGGGRAGGRAAAAPAQPQRGQASEAAGATSTPAVVAERPVTGAETTVMLRNIPNRYTQGMLLALLDEHNFKSNYDFVYLPMDFRNGVNLGYAFVNLLSHQDALRFMEAFQGFARWFFDSAKVCEVSWAHPHQGLHEHVERYRNSPVMHPTMPEEYKPMIFKDGERVPFPAPTKAIRAPKLRPVHDRPNNTAQQEQ
mmetsp:Transcript_26699/g.84720  ORF Transcript_26699/g.84720 Transcript_26699/m.84720 type:complete len:396 (-) Transcript_26699:255-1442(-)